MAKKQISADILSSIDEHGNRLYLQPAEVKGFYRDWRTKVQVLLMFVFLATPWTTINGMQSILLDIPQREFYIFGFLFRAHNAPLIFFLLFGGAITLAFVTTVWGRVWCGWACPQTVFIDGVFRRIEYFVEGNYLNRRKMQTEPMTVSTFTKKIVKWILFTLASSLIAHSFLAYFVGAKSFIQIIEDGPSANMTVFIVAQFFTALFLFDFGWFREQFCTIMCPYGRIQGLLLDKNSLAVAYEEKREADCVKCNRCVSACPIGIDIRNGLQMECIACTACIDACDEIMEKVEKPKGLIKYKTLDDQPIKLTKPRSLLYLVAILLCIVGLSYNLINLEHSEVFLVRAKDEPFKASETDIINHFKIHVTNQSFAIRKYKLRTENHEMIELIKAQNEITLKPKEFREWHVFAKISRTEFKPQLKIKLTIFDSENEKDFSRTLEAELLGPAN
ncbi:MAG: cytochrome c oxidase accessory protein CcoG [Pseudobdellovibrio sp.]